MVRGWQFLGTVAIVVSLGFVSTLAEAREYYINDSTPYAKKCYVKTFVPAKVRVNTEGRLVRPQKKQWVVRKVGTIEKWELVTQPAIYVETREIVDPAHYTLRPVACEAVTAPAKPAPTCYRSGGDRVVCEPDWSKTGR